MEKVKKLFFVMCYHFCMWTMLILYELDMVKLKEKGVKDV